MSKAFQLKLFKFDKKELMGFALDAGIITWQQANNHQSRVMHPHLKSVVVGSPAKGKDAQPNTRRGEEEDKIFP